MSSKRKTIGALGLAFLLGVGATLFLSHGNLPSSRAAEPEKAHMNPRYTIVKTDTNFLLVTDNQTNKFYYYTMDEEKEPGTELKLHATVDLTQVGKPVLKAEIVPPEEKRVNARN